MKLNSPSSFTLRPATAGDLPTLRRIYSNAVSAAGPAAYTPEQVEVWRGFADDPRFTGFVLDIATYVAEVAREIAGFCGINPAGHIASLYIAAEHAGRGLGTALLERVIALHPTPAAGRYFAEASRFSLSVFKRCGFHEVGRDRVVRGGVSFERILVERRV